MEGGDGAGLKGDDLVLCGDGGIGLFELGFTLGEFGAELGEGVNRDGFGLLGVVLGKKHLGEVVNLLRERLAA